ncbi:hypothetical protein BDP27DRAFT_1451039 [Rhodocollybia butyracea]|uniref:Uncharacterized protein n=1 Tax=Rhodocollybia butyracea TaxID=206335 RepID=A0A9P5U2G0_9AGAR|nr:hypothetical protein BDP27DRAFT_1451039 [Rhodocollybia butyracea]
MLIRKLIFQTSKIRPSSPGLTTVFLNHRYVSTTSKPKVTPSEKPVLDPYLKVPKVGGGRTFSRSHNISTLDPARLVPTDFIDLKQQLYFAVRYRNISVMFATYKRVAAIAKRTEYGYPLAFPAGTHGYFYLHHPPTDAHPCAATLRFRICDKILPPQKGFPGGKDLLLPTGAPWEMDLLHLLTTPYVTNFREALLLDNMVLSEEALSQLNGLLAAHRIRDRLPSRNVFSFRQPFSVSMGKRSTMLSLVDLQTNTLLPIQIFTQIAERTDKTLASTMCLEYDPFTPLHMVIRVLHIPEEFRGEAYVNMGGTLPLRKAGGKLTSSMADVLLRQSPSVPSHVSLDIALD